MPAGGGGWYVSCRQMFVRGAGLVQCAGAPTAGGKGGGRGGGGGLAALARHSLGRDPEVLSGCHKCVGWLRAAPAGTMTRQRPESGRGSFRVRFCHGGVTRAWQQTSPFPQPVRGVGTRNRVCLLDCPGSVLYPVLPNRRAATPRWWGAAATYRAGWGRSRRARHFAGDDHPPRLDGDGCESQREGGVAGEERAGSAGGAPRAATPDCSSIVRQRRGALRRPSRATQS